MKKKYNLGARLLYFIVHNHVKGCVLYSFLAVPWVGLRSVNVVCPRQTYGFYVDIR